MYSVFACSDLLRECLVFKYGKNNRDVHKPCLCAPSHCCINCRQLKHQALTRLLTEHNSVEKIILLSDFGWFMSKI